MVLMLNMCIVHNYSEQMMSCDFTVAHLDVQCRNPLWIGTLAHFAPDCACFEYKNTLKKQYFGISCEKVWQKFGK